MLDALAFLVVLEVGVKGARRGEMLMAHAAMCLLRGRPGPTAPRPVREQPAAVAAVGADPAVLIEVGADFAGHDSTVTDHRSACLSITTPGTISPSSDTATVTEPGTCAERSDRGLRDCFASPNLGSSTTLTSAGAFAFAQIRKGSGSISHLSGNLRIAIVPCGNLTVRRRSSSRDRRL